MGSLAVKKLIKKINNHVKNTVDQINNTLAFLSEYGLVRTIKDVVSCKEQNIETVTWDNHAKGRHNAGKAFTTLNQYVSIYETGAYHCILFDGSIIRAYFKFNRNILINESFLYWPAPILIPEEYVDELGIREAIDMCFPLITSTSRDFFMRSPIRFDFDSSKVSEIHPETHVHIQHSECRISAKRPICFNTFFKFVFFNFYPDKWIEKLNGLESINYSGFKGCEKAIISL